MEFSASQIEAAAACIRATGSAVVRGAWTAERLAPFRATIAGYVEARRARIASDAVRPLDRMLDTHGAGTISEMEASGFVIAMPALELLEGSVFAEICRAYYGDARLRTQFSRNGFRAHDPRRSSKSFIPYHQDSYTQDSRVLSVLNCWTPLDPAGIDAPGLEVVRDPCVRDFPRRCWGLESENAAYDKITIERERIVAAYGADAFLAPSFAVGDCLIFSEHVIHRTYVTPEMTRPRINMELRVFAEGVCTQMPGLPRIQKDSFPLRDRGFR